MSINQDYIEKTVAKARKNNLEAFDVLYKTYSNYIYSIILNFFNRDIVDAEDLMQEVFLEAFKSLDRLKDDKAFSSWLVSIALNKCRQYVRKKNFHKNKAILVPIEEHDVEVDEKYFPDTLLESKLNREVILGAIDELPSRQRLVMLLFYFQSFTYKEMVDSLELPMSTIKKDLHKGRNTIKKELKSKLSIEETSSGIGFSMIFMEYGNHMMGKKILPESTVATIGYLIKKKLGPSKLTTFLKIGAGVLTAFLIMGILVATLPNLETQAILKEARIEQPNQGYYGVLSQVAKQKNAPNPYIAEDPPLTEITNTAFVNGEKTNTVTRVYDSSSGAQTKNTAIETWSNLLPKTGGTILYVLGVLLIGLGLFSGKFITRKKTRKKGNLKGKIKQLGIWVIVGMISSSVVMAGYEHIKAEDITPVPLMDYSNQVMVLDWNLLDSNGNPLSETNQAIYYRTYQLWLNFQVIPPNGEVLHQGDTFKIELPKNSTASNWGGTASAYEDFTDSLGTVLGQWRLTDTHVEGVFGSNVEGANSSNITLLTGGNALRNYTTLSLTQNVTLGNITKSIQFKKASLNYMSPSDSKRASAVSNDTIEWMSFVNSVGITELTQKPWGTTFSEARDVYFEDPLNGRFSGNINIFALVTHPTELLTGKGSNDYYPINVNAKFTQITQSEGESYVDFKARLNPFQYGVYEDVNQKQTLVVYFGTIGNNGMTYESLDSDFINHAASVAINAGFYDESARMDLVDFYTQAFGANNVIQGNVARYRLDFSEIYEKVIVDTPKTNVATLTKNEIGTQLSGTGVLQGNKGAAVISKNRGGVFLYDEETEDWLPGATFKLQYKNGAIWEDYSSVGLLTTDANGTSITPDLGLGTYRFVEVKSASEAYDLSKSKGYDPLLETVVSQEFTIASTDVDGHRISVSNVKKKYKVTYDKGLHGAFDPCVFEHVVINSPTPAYNGVKTEQGEPVGEAGYIFAGWDKPLSETVDKDEVYTAQWQKIIKGMIAINKRVDVSEDKQVISGDVITYTITAENKGDTDSASATITDTIPKGTTYVKNSATKDTVIKGDQLTLSKKSLAPGQVLTLTFKVKVK